MLESFLNKYYQNNGWVLFYTGILHNTVGIVGSYKIISDMAKRYLVNTVTSDTESVGNLQNFGILWFLSSGVAWMLYGYLIQKYKEGTKSRIPQVLNYGFFGFSVLTFVVMPESGAILLVLQSILNLWDRYVEKKSQNSPNQLVDEQ